MPLFPLSVGRLDVRPLDGDELGMLTPDVSARVAGPRGHNGTRQLRHDC